MRHRDELYVKISDAPLPWPLRPEGAHPGTQRERRCDTLRSTWRGSCMFASAVNGLEERMKDPHYDVYGPWPVGPGL